MDTNENKTTELKKQPHKQQKTMKTHLLQMLNLLVQIRRSRVDTKHEEYNRVIDIELLAAIKKCENNEKAIFEMCYPLAESGMLHGFMGVKSYMLNLFYENTFCNKYDSEEVRRFSELCEIRKSGKATYNIYSKLYLNALFCEYLQKDVGTLKITLDDCNKAQKLLNSFDEQRQYELLAECSNRMSGVETHNYNAKMFERLSPKILSAVRRKRLPSFLVVDNL